MTFPGQTQGQGPDSGNSLSRERLSDVIQHAYGAPARAAMGTDPTDGLPTLAVDQGNSDAAPLSIDHFVCMADEREFVKRSKLTGEITDRYSPDQVTRCPNGTFWVGEPKCNIREVDPFPNRVHPIREQCQYFLEQITDFEGPNSIINVRLCARHADENGFITLGDQQVLACSARTPQDFVSEERLRKFNNRCIRTGAERAAAGGVYDLTKFDDKPDPLDGILK